MTEPGTSALVALIPSAQPLLDAAARVNPDLVRDGLPPHATILYPFLPAGELDAGICAQLRSVAVRAAVPILELSRIIARTGFVGVEAPQLAPLASSIQALWPQILPYGGRFGAQPPVHVTVAMGAGEQEEKQVRDAIGDLLPIRQQVTAIELVSRSTGGWRSHQRFALGG